jgi:predicted ATPase/class 3 adenylate cyclase
MSELLLKAFLFTDLVGSTAQWDEDASSMSAALKRHDEVLERVVADTQGSIFKHTGDGMCVVFDAPEHAILAAIAIQRALSGDDQLALRVGIHFGQAEQRDGDWFGTTLNRTARIMSIAHGGQVLVSRAVASILDPRSLHGATFERLGLVRLRGLTEPEQIFQVVADGLVAEFPALSGLESDTLPTPRTAFLGRGSEVEALRDLLRKNRLVTIAGVGGTGKTRLSIEVARSMLEAFADGATFIDLSDVDSLEGAIGAVGAALGVQDSGQGGAMSDLRRSSLRALGERELLLVLDNCEHLLDEAATLSDEVLDRCAGVTILVTSREPLAVEGERVWRVPALDQETALALLLDRARAHDAGFDLNETDRALGLDVCRRLDFLPLAIELVAARLATMSISDIATRLDDRFRLLAGRGRRHDRHATMRAALDWSFELLSGDERILLTRLSVFIGGFALEAAEQVCSDEILSTVAVLDLLEALVDKSLIQIIDQRSSRRFGLLETIRAYAAEHLASMGETASMRSSHARWCERLSMEFWAAFSERRFLHDDMETESDNLRAGHELSLEQAQPLSAQWIASAWTMALQSRGHSAEALRRCEAALDLPGGSSLTRHLCTASAGLAASWVGDGEKAWELALKAIDSIETSSVTPLLGWLVAATARELVGNEAPGPSLVEIIHEVRKYETEIWNSRADHYLARHLMREGQFDEALEIFQRTSHSDGLNHWLWFDRLTCCWTVDAESVERSDIEALMDRSDDHLLLIDARIFELVVSSDSATTIRSDSLNDILMLIHRGGWNTANFRRSFSTLAAVLGHHATGAMLWGGSERIGTGAVYQGRMEPGLRSALGNAEFDRLASIGASMSELELEEVVRSLAAPVGAAPMR